MLTKADKKLVRDFMRLVRRATKHCDRLAQTVADATDDRDTFGTAKHESLLDELSMDLEGACDGFDVFIHSGSEELIGSLAAYDQAARKAQRILK